MLDSTVRRERDKLQKENEFLNTAIEHAQGFYGKTKNHEWFVSTFKSGKQIEYRAIIAEKAYKIHLANRTIWSYSSHCKKQALHAVFDQIEKIKEKENEE